MTFTKRELKYFKYRIKKYPFYVFLFGIICLCLTSTGNIFLAHRLAVRNGSSFLELFQFWSQGIQAGLIYPGSQLLAFERLSLGIFQLVLIICITIFAYAWHRQRSTYVKLQDLLTDLDGSEQNY